jgi:hypothetical protein
MWDFGTTSPHATTGEGLDMTIKAEPYFLVMKGFAIPPTMSNALIKTLVQAIF